MLTTRREFVAAVLASRLLPGDADDFARGADEQQAFTYTWPWSRFWKWQISAGFQIGRQHCIRFDLSGVQFDRIHVRLCRDPSAVLTIATLDMQVLRSRGHIMVPDTYKPQADLAGQSAVDAVVEEAMLGLLLRSPAATVDDPALQAFACLVTERMLVDNDGKVDDELANRRRATYEQHGHGLWLPSDIKWLRYADDGRLHGSYRDG